MKKIILIGAGGHCKSCIDVIEKNKLFKISGIIDNNKSKKILNYKIIGRDKNLKKIGYKLPVIISPLSYVSKHAKIGEGTIIMHNSVINAGVKIGKNCIINSMSLIEHDVSIGDHCHISTRATINGSVKIGRNTFIGSNSTLKHGIKIGNRSIINSKKLVKKNVKNDSLLR